MIPNKFNFYILKPKKMLILITHLFFIDPEEMIFSIVLVFQIKFYSVLVHFSNNKMLPLRIKNIFK